MLKQTHDSRGFLKIQAKNIKVEGPMAVCSTYLEQNKQKSAPVVGRQNPVHADNLLTVFNILLSWVNSLCVKGTLYGTRYSKGYSERPFLTCLKN